MEAETVQIASVSTGKRIKYIFSQTWKFFFSILMPILLFPILLWEPKDHNHKKAPYAVYLTMLMAAYWVSECLPLAITSFLPIVLVPLFAIADSGISTHKLTYK